MKCMKNYNLTKEERRALWRTLEKTYLPHKKYEEDKFLENGGFCLDKVTSLMVHFII